MFHLFRSLALLLIAACSSGLASSQALAVDKAWARATVQGQKGTGVFMNLRSDAGVRLLSAESPLAAFGEVHTMRMEGDVMKMQALKEGLEIPPGKLVELKPGSLHLMLMDLKQPLQKDSILPLTLVFVDARGLRGKLDLTVPVSALAPMALDHSGH